MTDSFAERFRRTRLHHAAAVLVAGLAVAFVAAWAFGDLIIDVIRKQDLEVFDRPFVRYLALHRSDDLTAAMKATSFFGGTLFVVACLIVAAVWAYRRTHHFRWPLFFLATMAGAVATDNLVKLVVHRARPNIHPLVHPFGTSFPSGHATASAVLFATLALYVGRGRTFGTRAVLWSLAVIVPVAVGLSRVYLGAHWPTDVLAGFALGAFWTAVGATAAARIRPGSIAAVRGTDGAGRP